MRRHPTTIGVDLPPHRPDCPERDLIVAIVQQTRLDASGAACAPAGRWVCLRADAIDAARSDYLRDLVGLVGLEHVIEAIGRLPICCDRVAGREAGTRTTSADSTAAPVGSLPAAATITVAAGTTTTNNLPAPPAELKETNP